MATQQRTYATDEELLGHRRLRDTFRIIKQLGTGGIGVVYLVEHVQLRKYMALKILHADVGEKVSFHRLFTKESRALSRLSHPHTVALFDAGRLRNGDVYVLMEYVPGVDLARFCEMRGKTLSLPHIITVAQQICQALSHAHNAGIYLRDLKPSNVMLTRDQDQIFIKLLDFGMTAALERACRVPKVDESALAPELLRGTKATAQSDIYSLGTLLFQQLTGQPFWPQCDRDLLFPQTHYTQKPQKDHAAAQRLRHLVWQTLSTQASERPISAELVANSLQHIKDTHFHDQPAEPLALQHEASEPRENDASSTVSPREWKDFQAKYELMSWAMRLVMVLLLLGGIGGMINHFHIKLQRNQGTLDPQRPQQEQEPNDSPTRSTPLQLEQWAFGTLGCKRCTPAIPAARDIDWFHFSIPSGGAYVGIRLLIPRDSGAQIALYREDQMDRAIATSRYWQAHEIRIPGVQLNEGRYRIKLSSPRAIQKANRVSYRFLVAKQTVRRSGEVEPNQTRANANLAAVGAYIDGRHDTPNDVDTFVFALPSAAQLRKLAAQCPKCLPQRERSPELGSRWPTQPIFHLRLTPVDGMQASLELLDAKGKAISVVRRDNQFDDGDDHKEHGGRQENHGGDKGFASEKGQHIDVYFTGAGRHYLRIKSKGGFHYTKRYSWRIELYATQ